MGILEFLECFDPLTEICVEDATEVVFEGRAEDFPEEKDKAYIIVPSRTNNRDGVIRLFVSKQEYLEKKCGQNKIYVLDALLAILYSVMRKNSEAKSSLSAIQIYLPFANSIPFLHCLKTLPEFC